MTVKPPAEEAYLTWNDEQGRALAMAQVHKGLKEAHPIVRSHASNIYQNVGPGNVSVRDGYSRRDYEYFRYNEAIPCKPKDIIRACNDAYENVGLIQNVINLMSEFAVKGLNVTHPNERIEKFHREWYRRVNGLDRSERFLCNFYKSANVIVKRQFTTLSENDTEQLKRTIAVTEGDIKLEKLPTIGTQQIPWRYNFLNPLSVEHLCEEVAPFVGPEAFIFGIRIPESLARLVKDPRTQGERMVVKQIPPETRKLIADGGRLIPLDPNKVSAHYYKRDDWQAWAKPMVHSILSDLNMLQKMKLADISALDGAISCIRIWKLGNLEYKIMPSAASIAHLSEVLCSNVGGGVMDFVWGPDIELLETKTDVHQFLGETKYAPVLSAIFQGLGFPVSLTGGPSKEGLTNNFVSLKAFIERLEYGRSVLKAFWDAELRLVQRAMGFRFPATTTFDNILTDEAAEKRLLIDLMDRNILSEESVKDKFGFVPEIEDFRIRRQERKRENGQIPKKASPYHDPMFEESLQKIFAQSGAYSPSQFGVELDAKKGQSPAELTAKVKPDPVGTVRPPPKKGESGQGRPPGKKDTEKRKQRTPKPRTKGDFITQLAWSEEAQGAISRFFSPAYLASLGKKTLRELTEEESRNLEDFKFAVLCSLQPGQAIGDELLRDRVGTDLSLPVPIATLVKATVAKWIATNGKEPTLEVLRKLRASAYVLFKGDFTDAV